MKKIKQDFNYYQQTRFSRQFGMHLAIILRSLGYGLSIFCVSNI